jgi:hypothetical protein
MTPSGILALASATKNDVKKIFTKSNYICKKTLKLLLKAQKDSESKVNADKGFWSLLKYSMM